MYVNSHEYEDTFTTTGCTVKHIRDPHCFIALVNPGINIFYLNVTLCEDDGYISYTNLSYCITLYNEEVRVRLGKRATTYIMLYRAYTGSTIIISLVWKYAYLL